MSRRLILAIVAAAVLLALAATLLAGLWAPKASGEDGYQAEARYCAPTAVKCQGWGGDAKLAAVHSFTFGDDPYWVRVSRGGRHVDALVVSFCRCADRDDRIDLSPSAFMKLGPLSAGVLNVTVRRIPEGPDDARMREEVRSDALYTLPPTDTDGN